MSRAPERLRVYDKILQGLCGVNFEHRNSLCVRLGTLHALLVSESYDEGIENCALSHTFTTARDAGMSVHLPAKIITY